MFQYFGFFLSKVHVCMYVFRKEATFYMIYLYFSADKIFFFKKGVFEIHKTHFEENA